MRSVPFQVVRDAYLAKRPGGLFFSRDAVKMFDTRHPRLAFPGPDGALYFVTSEMDFDGVVRRFTVRVQSGLTGEIHTVSDYLEFATHGKAMRLVASSVGVAA